MSTPSSHQGKTIGLIGCGLWGRNILRDLCALGCKTLVVDPAARCRRDAESVGAAAVFSEIDQLPEVDGVIVATPASTHARVIEDILPRWPVPIFCEKPFTTTLASARRLVDLAGDRLFIMHVWRYHHGVELLGQWARGGTLGPVQMLRTVRTNWTSPRRDVDGIWTLAPHDLSIALEILGSLPEGRFAQAEWRNSEPVGLLGILGDRVPFIFEVSTRYADKRREIRLHCRDGVAVLPHGEADFLEVFRGADSVDRIALPNEAPLLRELRTFLAFLDGGPPPRSNCHDALQILTRMIELRTLAGIPESVEDMRS